jgi:hypothetical protein
MARDGDIKRAKVKYVLIVLCAFSVCAKIDGHAYRHLHPTSVSAAAQ